MLLEFKVKNFKSIYELTTFSMLPSGKFDESKIELIRKNGQIALPTSAIYGRNAAGKSNLIKALDTLQTLVTNSFDIEAKESLPYYPFILSESSQKEPTFLSATFIAEDGIKYLYEIEYLSTEILIENLYFYPKSQKAKLYERTGNKKLSFGEYFDGSKKALKDFLYNTQSLLSKVRSANIPQLRVPFNFFSQLLLIQDTPNQYSAGLFRVFAETMYNNVYKHYEENISRLMKVADTGIEAITAKKRNTGDISLSGNYEKSILDQVRYNLEYYFLVEKKVIGKDKTSWFNINEESTGTRKLLEIGTLILEALYVGQTIIFDEFDLSLHPKLTTSLVKLFNSFKSNPKGAQLIITTHDITLLDSGSFTYDQIWIAEKTETGISEYYSFSDITGLRKNVPLQKWYMEGRLGGTPMINEHELIFDLE